MENVELERLLLIKRYGELKEMVIPFLDKTQIAYLFNDNFENCDNDTIKEIMLDTLSSLESRLNVGIYVSILLEYKDLLKSEDPKAKTIKLRIEPRMLNFSRILV